MFRMLLEVRSAARGVVRARLVSGLAVLAFALGIGVTTAVFSIYNGVLLEPLPFSHPEQLVAVYDTQPACTACPASFPKYHDWRERNRVFTEIGGVMRSAFVLTGGGEPARLPGARTTASFGAVFAVRPLLGRWYSADEDRPGGPKVVVLSHDLWMQRFGADPRVLGRTIVLDGESYEVVGVLPQGIAWARAELYVPLQRALDPATRGNHFLQTFARLRPGVTVAGAAAEMRALGATLAREFGNNHGIDVRAYTEVMVGSVRTPLDVLLGAVFLLLLIACANVASLLLAAGMARQRELAIRLALGAGPRDLARQLTVEGVLLGLAGGAAGVLLAVWMVRTFVALAGTELPRAANIAVDGRVLAFAALVSLAVGVFCGVWPLVALRRREVASTIREGDSRTISGAGLRFGNGLVIAEIALAFTLLVGAGLLVKNLEQLRSRDAGLRTDRVVSLSVEPSGPRYASDESAVAYYHELYDRLVAIEGTEAIGMISHLPMYDFGWNGEFSIEGSNPWPPNEAPLVEYRWFYGNYFRTLGVPLLKGRRLDARDGKGSNAVLINHAMAEKFWPGQDPLGKWFGQGPDRSAWYQVVGVVGDVRSFGLARATPYEFYRTIDESSFNPMTIVIRTRSADPTAVVPTVRRIVASLDDTVPVAHVQTMAQVVSESVGQPRLMSALTGVFGGLAGLLAMVGVYGVMAYNVRRQRREFGIRLALGAEAGGVQSLVIRRAVTLAGLGVAIGLIGSLWLTRLLEALLNDVKPTDPAVFGATAVAVLAVGFLASYLPARAASRVDPMIVLRDT